MRQNFIAQFIQLLKHWLCNIWLGIVMEENWALSVDHFWVQALQFSAYLLSLLSISLDVMLHQDSENWSGLDRQQTTKQ